MFTCKDQPRCNSFTKQILVDKNFKRSYWNKILDKFLNEFILPSEAAPETQQKKGTNTDMVTNHALQLLQYFFLLEDFKDAVKEGNGRRLNQLHKQLLHYFKTDDGHNSYAIEMLISVIQNEVFLNDAEAHQCTWAATANSKGGEKKN